MEVEHNNGESSRSHQLKNGMMGSRLILPEWDVPPLKHVHASQDLITLLHLDGLYNTYVRPFTERQAEDQHMSAVEGAAGNEGLGDGANGNGGGGVKTEDGQMMINWDSGGLGGKKVRARKKRRLERGYAHLLEDVMDPTPLGEKPHTASLVPLLADAWNPPAAPTHLTEEDIQILPPEVFQIALLEPGQKQDGYGLGRKHGVAEAEEKRQRKHVRHSQSLVPPDLPSPHLSPPQNASSPTAASTPLPPVPPPTTLPHRPSFPINTTRRPAHSARPSFSGPRYPSLNHPPGPGGGGPNRPRYSTPNSFRGGNGPHGEGAGRGPFARPGGSFNTRGSFITRGRGGPGGGGGARGRGFSRPPSFGGGAFRPQGPQGPQGPDGGGSGGGGGGYAGHKRGRESVGDMRDAKRSRE